MYTSVQKSHWLHREYICYNSIIQNETVRKVFNKDVQELCSEKSWLSEMEKIRAKEGIDDYEWEDKEKIIFDKLICRCNVIPIVFLVFWYIHSEKYTEVSKRKTNLKMKDYHRDHLI